MQLQGASELELRISELLRRVESEMPASELATTIVATLSDSGNELQRIRGIAGITAEQSYPRKV